jgi:hypothetical protein
MKTSTLFLVLFAAIIAAPAFGQAETTDTTPAAKPDFSRENLQRFVAEIPEPPKPDRKLRFYVGAVEFGAIGTRWRFNYLPFMTPLSGTRMGISQEMPDPFSLTGTVIATPRRAWRTQRQVNAEMRRIEQTERAKLRVAQ